jgi:hypothetical protein
MLDSPGTQTLRRVEVTLSPVFSVEGSLRENQSTLKRSRTLPALGFISKDDSRRGAVKLLILVKLDTLTYFSYLPRKPHLALIKLPS